jgi:hypothetical protein
MVIVRSPSFSMSTAARKARPIKRLISVPLASGLPFLISRSLRSIVLRGQHAVLGRDPTGAFALQERWNFFFHAGGTEHPSVALLHQHGTFGMFGEVPRERDRPQRVGFLHGFHCNMIWPLHSTEAFRKRCLFSHDFALMKAFLRTGLAKKAWRSFARSHYLSADPVGEGRAPVVPESSVSMVHAPDVYLSGRAGVGGDASEAGRT